MSHKTHWEHLAELVPNLGEATILDVGSGKGSFLVEAAAHGANVIGLEKSKEYISSSLEKAKSKGLRIQVEEGVAEKLPFPDASFSFVNACEVIEHVEDPHKMLSEAYRVLQPGGHMYVSVPNRFGMKDQHFHLYGVNWLPRFLADLFISVFGKHKNYSDASAGRQRLADMHYYTFNGSLNVAAGAGFRAEDIRALRIQRERKGIARLALQVLYRLLRPWYFDSFHLLLSKPS